MDDRAPWTIISIFATARLVHGRIADWSRVAQGWA
jgi:hypothetical protein